jgi:hypothetical protein
LLFRLSVNQSLPVAYLRMGLIFDQSCLQHSKIDIGTAVGQFSEKG